MPNISLPMSVQAVGIVVRPDRAVPITKKANEVTPVLSSDPSGEVLTDRCGTPSSLTRSELAWFNALGCRTPNSRPWAPVLCLANRQEDNEQLIAVAIVGPSCFHDGRQFGPEMLLHQGRRLLPQWDGCKDGCQEVQSYTLSSIHACRADWAACSIIDAPVKEFPPMFHSVIRWTGLPCALQ